MKTLFIALLSFSISSIATASNWCSSSGYDKKSGRIEGTCQIIGDSTVQIDKDYVTNKIGVFAIDENGKQYFFRIAHATPDINIAGMMLPNDNYPLALVSGGASPLWKELEKQGLKDDGRKWNFVLGGFELTPSDGKLPKNQVYKGDQKLILNIPKTVSSGCKWGSVEENKPSSPKKLGPNYLQLLEESDRTAEIDPAFCAQHMLPGIKKVCFGTVTCDGEEEVAVCEASGDNACPTPDECFNQGFRKNWSTVANKPRTRADLLPTEDDKVKFELRDYAIYYSFVREIEATGVPSQGICVGNAQLKLKEGYVSAPCIAVFTNTGCPDARTCQLQKCFKEASNVGDKVPKPEFKSYSANPNPSSGIVPAGGRR